MSRSITALAAACLVSCSGPKPIVDIVPPSVVELLARPEVTEATIRGIVITDDHRSRIGWARIALDDSTTRVFSGDDGRFTLTAVAPGQQVIHVRRLGYRRLDQVVTMPSGHGAAIVILLAEERVCLDCDEQVLPPSRHSRLENVP